MADSSPSPSPSTHSGRRAILDYLPVAPGASKLGTTVRRWAVVGLVVFGVQLWLTAGRGIWGRNFQLKLLVGIQKLGHPERCSAKDPALAFGAESFANTLRMTFYFSLADWQI